MNRPSDFPKFTLFCHVQEPPRSRPETRRAIDSQGRWHFRIQTSSGQVWLEASDTEAGASHERLELLAVVRGLEAFDQPSQVTLVTPNPQIARSVRQGLDYWRDRDWMWERFGEKVPMSNRDLWQRVDRATRIHLLRSRTHRFDAGHDRASLLKRKQRPSPAVRERRPETRAEIRPLAAATRIAAKGLHRIADTLVAWTPDSSKPFPAA